MLFLPGASTKMTITIDGGVVHVHASYVDKAATGIVTPGAKNTVQSGAGSADIVLAPGAGVTRGVELIQVTNYSTSYVICTLKVDSGTATVLDSWKLPPGERLVWRKGRRTYQPRMYCLETGVPIPKLPTSYSGRLYGCTGNCNPATTLREMWRAGNTNPTTTQISTSIARCSMFMPPNDIIVNRIRAYGVGATTDVYRCAIYRYSDLARLTDELPFSTIASTWTSIGDKGPSLQFGLDLPLYKGVQYFIAVSVNAATGVAGVMAFGATVVAAVNMLNIGPGGCPGSLDADKGILSSYLFELTGLTNGALPNPAATVAKQSAWSGGMPAFLLDAMDC